MSLTVSNLNVFSQNTVKKTTPETEVKVSNVFDSNAENKTVTSPQANEQEFWPIVVGGLILMGLSYGKCKRENELQRQKSIEDEKSFSELMRQNQSLYDKELKTLYDKRKALFDIPTIRVLEAEMGKLWGEYLANDREISRLEALIKNNDELGIQYNKNAVIKRIEKLQEVNRELKSKVHDKREEFKSIVTKIYDSTEKERNYLKEEAESLDRKYPTRIVYTSSVEGYTGYSEAERYYAASENTPWTEIW